MLLDSWRLAVGTLTAVRVKPPGTVDRSTARGAMLLAPLAVAPLGVLAGLAVWLGRHLELPGPAVGLLTVGVLALGSRAFHIDGLSDVADGLTASHDRERSLAVMKSGSSGPAGTAAVVVVLGLQAAAIGGFGFVTHPYAPLLAGVLVCLSRCALVVTCVRGVPSAREDGLGNPFAGSVPRSVAIAVWLAVVVALQVLVDKTAQVPPGPRGALTAVVALLVLGLLVDRAVRRFGGVTGDVYGAAVELTLTVMLLGCFAGPILLAG